MFANCCCSPSGQYEAYTYDEEITYGDLIPEEGYREIQGRYYLAKMAGKYGIGSTSGLDYVPNSFRKGTYSVFLQSYFYDSVNKVDKKLRDFVFMVEADADREYVYVFANEYDAGYDQFSIDPEINDVEGKVVMFVINATTGVRIAKYNLSSQLTKGKLTMEGFGRATYGLMYEPFGQTESRMIAFISQFKLYLSDIGQYEFYPFIGATKYNFLQIDLLTGTVEHEINTPYNLNDYLPHFNWNASEYGYPKSGTELCDRHIFDLDNIIGYKKITSGNQLEVVSGKIGCDGTKVFLYDTVSWAIFDTVTEMDGVPLINWVQDIHKNTYLAVTQFSIEPGGVNPKQTLNIYKNAEHKQVFVEVFNTLDTGHYLVSRLATRYFGGFVLVQYPIYGEAGVTVDYPGHSYLKVFDEEVDTYSTITLPFYLVGYSNGGYPTFYWNSQVRVNSKWISVEAYPIIFDPTVQHVEQDSGGLYSDYRFTFGSIEQSALSYNYFHLTQIITVGKTVVRDPVTEYAAGNNFWMQDPLDENNVVFNTAYTDKLSYEPILQWDSVTQYGNGLTQSNLYQPLNWIMLSDLPDGYF